MVGEASPSSTTARSWVAPFWFLLPVLTAALQTAVAKADAVFAVAVVVVDILLQMVILTWWDDT